jgi:hypothetical protein
MMTHAAIKRRFDARLPEGWSKKVLLRETMTHWVDHLGVHYRKRTGSTCEKWPMYCIDLKTIEKLAIPVKL